MASKVTCTRRLTFCAGHRVAGHENKCANFHGHNYVVEVEVAMGYEVTTGVDAIGRVVDFSVVKQLVGGWLDANWDHGMVLWQDDPLAQTIAGIVGMKLFIMAYNPTAENMARFLLDLCNITLFPSLGIQATRVVVHETENCKAEASL